LRAVLTAGSLIIDGLESSVLGLAAACAHRCPFVRDICAEGLDRDEGIGACLITVSETIEKSSAMLRFILRKCQNTHPPRMLRILRLSLIVYGLLWLLLTW